MKPHTQCGIRSLCLIFVFCSLAFTLSAAWLTNQPTTRIQPDRSILECLVSGDEFYQRLHDQDNYTIIQHPQTGYYTYAEQDGENVKAGSLRVGRDANRQNLTPGITISERLYKQKRSTMFQTPDAQRATPSTGTVNNLNVFIRFADQNEFGQQISVYDGWLNTNPSSLKGYFLETSYNALNVNSSFYPPAVGGFVVSYQDSLVRERYVPYNAVTAPLGWHDEEERRILEHNLLRACIMQIEQFVPLDLNIDTDGNGVVDNITFIVAGSDQGGLLWPHWWQLHTYVVNIRGKRVWGYNLQLQNFLYNNNVGVLAHEFYHSIGAPDLYRVDTQDIAPANVWDVMAATLTPPQHMNAYMKYKYGGWISSIPVITSDQVYTLNPLTSSTGQVYRINSPNTTDEFFILEYRKMTGTYENSLPGSGLLVWRINTTCGNGNTDGPPDELYVYRPHGTTTINGSPWLAYFSSEAGRTAINDATDPNSFLSNGTAGGLSIKNIGAPGATISFTKGPVSYIDFSVTNPYLQGFNTTTSPPSDWWTTIENGTIGFDHVTSSTTPSVTPYEGTRMLRYACRNAVAGSQAIISSKPFLIDNMSNYDYKASFRMYRDTGYPSNYDRIEIFYNTTAFLDGHQILLGSVSRSTALSPVVPTPGWYEYNYTLYPSRLGYYYIIIKATSANGNNILIDSFALQRVTLSATTCRWQGNFSQDWHNPDNWRNGVVPDADKDVIIPYNTDSLPSVDNANGFCRDLYVESGAVLMVAGRSLLVYRNAFISGSIYLLNNSTMMEVSRNIYFAGNSNVMCYSAGATLEVYRECIINNPEQFSMVGGILKLSGSLNYALHSNSALAIIDRLHINKTGGATVLYSSPTSSVLRINTEFNIPSYSSFTAEEEAGTIECMTSFTPAGNVFLSAGTLTFLSNSSLNLNSSSFLNNVTVQPGVQLTLSSSVTIKGNLVFNGSYIFGQNRTINIAGNWVTDTMLRFIGMGSTVIFDGSAHQYCSNSIFSTLVLNKLNGKLIINANQRVEADFYDFEIGTIEVNGGTFTAFDLVDYSIQGYYILNSGNINLTQDSSQHADIDAGITITAGNFTINGGINVPIEWASLRHVTINMSGGTLSFPESGISITDTGYNLNLNLTGGTIRCKGNISITRPNVNFNTVTLEMYGPNDSTLNPHSSTVILDLIINKGASRQEGLDARDSGQLRLNRVNLGSNLIIFNNFVIQSGTFNLNNCHLQVEGSMQVSGGLTMAEEDENLTVWGNLYWNQGASANVTWGSINLYGNITIANNANLMFSDENCITFKGSGQTGIYNYSSNCTFSSIVVEKESGSVSTFDSQPLTIQNFLIVNSPCTMYVSSNVTVSYYTGILSGAALYISDYMTTTDIHISGYLEMNNSVLICNGNFSLYGQMVMDNSFCGLYRIFGTAGILYPFYGALTLNSSVINITQNGVIFGPAASLNSNENGHIRVGWNFVATNPATFQPTNGSIELTGARNALIQCNNGNYFHNLVINKPAGYTVTTDADINIYKDLFVASGTFSPGAGTLTQIYEDLNVFANGVLNAAGAELKFVGYEPSVISAVPAITVSTLTVYKQYACTVDLNADLTLSGTTQFSIGRGYFRINDNTMIMNGNITVATRSKLALSEGSVLDLGDGSSITVSGIFTFKGFLDAMGSAANPAKITSSTGYYALNLNSGSVLKANYCIFEKLNSSGIHFYPNSALNTEFPMSNCTFQYGQNRGTLILYENDEVIDYVIPNANFPVVLDTNYKNVKKTTPSGSLTFLNVTGPHAGPTYEVDEFNTVHWIIATVPDPPLDLIITTNGTLVSLNWRAVTGVTGYKIYRAFSPTEMGSAVLVGTTASISWTDTASASNPKAFYRVRSYID